MIRNMIVPAFSIFIGLLIGLLAGPANAATTTISCHGKAVYNEGGTAHNVIIQNLLVTKTGRKTGAIEITFSVAGAREITKNYIITDWYENGGTDIGKTAIMIGATPDGDSKNYSDDISLPLYGEYRSGFGSHVTFYIDDAAARPKGDFGKQADGVVTCVEK